MFPANVDVGLGRSSLANSFCFVLEPIGSTSVAGAKPLSVRFVIA